MDGDRQGIGKNREEGIRRDKSKGCCYSHQS